MAKCKNCGESYNVLTADLGGSGLCQNCRATARTKTGGSAWRVVATVFSIADALVVIWFIVKAGEVVNNTKLAIGQANSAMQASQIYNEATVALLYYVCIILALILGQVCALATRVIWSRPRLGEWERSTPGRRNDEKSESVQAPQP